MTYNSDFNGVWELCCKADWVIVQIPKSSLQMEHFIHDDYRSCALSLNAHPGRTEDDLPNLCNTSEPTQPTQARSRWRRLNQLSEWLNIVLYDLMHEWHKLIRKVPVVEHPRLQQRVDNFPAYHPPPRKFLSAESTPPSKNTLKSSMAAEVANREASRVFPLQFQAVLTLGPLTIRLGQFPLTRRALANRTSTTGHGRVLHHAIEYPDDHDRESWTFTVLHNNLDSSMLQFQQFTADYVVNIVTLLRIGRDTFETGNVVHIEGTVDGFNETTSTFSIRVSALTTHGFQNHTNRRLFPYHRSQPRRY
ncbi:uncharacterized protein MELLADRAFT_60405 [Melampsora larici-populina 98AG31]|uniref:Uncharacterized protein n=1 Tax=Melampsora larici-populina (strain 98AG31 / pathotype 3-4-7) TaxID=747676 RepID=F4RA00_MELLP|nr:uncharacterized protein MELLADRAFT_60405 [Melampsora larici-populina 98AG31]EGG10657.1 hypothetical protein MELLADRAFT_60405 [Melampsora larici-populina 98AG31]